MIRDIIHHLIAYLHLAGYAARMAVPTQIASARRRRGLTQKQVADALNVSVQAVSQWETGKARVHQNRIKPLADLLSMDIADLIPSAGSSGERYLLKETTEELTQVTQSMKAIYSDMFLVLEVDAMPFEIPTRTEMRHAENVKRFAADRDPVLEFFGIRVHKSYPILNIEKGDLLIFDYGVHASDGDIVILRTMRSGVIQASRNIESEGPFRLARFEKREGNGYRFLLASEPHEGVADDPDAVRMILGTMVERRTYRSDQSSP